MKKTFAVLGAGMQGTAAAYDLATFADPAQILMGDRDLGQAQRSADRVNRLVGRTVCAPSVVDATNPESLGGWMQPSDVVLSCVPYYLHPTVAKTAVATRTSMVDLGGNTPITQQTLALDAQAKTAGITLVPDTGLAPGLVNSIGAWLIGQFDVAESVKLYCGVLPQHPVPPLNYKLTFNVEGLLAEYDYEAVVLRDGQIAMVDTLAELEEVEVEGLGRMEAFTTSGGTSTAPYTYQGKVANYQYKTIRFPGHCERIRLFRDFGLWGEEPIEVGGVRVIPREVFCRVFGERLARFEDEDQCIVRGVAHGLRDGKPAHLQVDIHDRQCPQTGFTSMERLTGFPMAIHAAEIAAGRIGPGAIRYELAMDPGRFLDEVRRRGIDVRVAGD